MKEQLKKALDYAKSLGVSYADIRFKDIQSERLVVENGSLANTSVSRSLGYGIRVYLDGSLGFAASNDLTKLLETAKEAYDIAKASLTLQGDKIQLDSKQPAHDKYASKVEIDPFTVPLTDKIGLLMDCDKIMTGVEGIGHTQSILDFRKDIVTFADTDGSYIEQSFCQCTADIAAKAIDSDDTQTRSYINVIRGGYEEILGLNLKERAANLAKEAVILLKALDCPSGEFDIVLTPRQLFLQIHESVGHPTELDRVLGSEAAFAGRSFVETEHLTTKPLVYGSEHVSLVADATCPKGLGTFAYDDEGVPAQCITLVDKGKFTAFQTSRDYAAVIGQNSSGGGLADGWENMPIVRMTNINLLPGKFTLDELIQGVEYGFLMDENKSWSIDDLRINFQFACEIAHEIKNGKLTGKIFKNPIYAGKTTEFWGSCDGVASEDFWELVGVPNCGKGQPMQVMRVSHGSSPARFRKVKVGVADVK